MKSYFDMRHPHAGFVVVPLVVDVSAAARLLDVSRTTLYKMLAAGELVSFVSGPKSRKVTVASIEAYVARQIAGQTGQRPDMSDLSGRCIRQATRTGQDIPL